jgi:hypothetical protein
MSLQRARIDTSLGELVRRARRRRETFDLIALAFRSIADRCKHENLIDRGALALV